MVEARKKKSNTISQETTGERQGDGSGTAIIDSSLGAWGCVQLSKQPCLRRQALSLFKIETVGDVFQFDDKEESFVRR
jgi:hypothetical protein